MKNNHQPYIKWYSSDFLAGVRGMSAAEVGIYTILINEMYERTHPLPINNKRLSWQCGCTQSTFKKALKMLIDEGKITLIDGCLWNSRVEKEFKNRKKRRGNASAAADARWKKANEINDDDMRMQCGNDADAMPIPETRNQKPESNTKVLPKENDLFAEEKDQKLEAKRKKVNGRKCQINKVLDPSKPIPPEYIEYAEKHAIRDISRLFEDWFNWWDSENGLKAGAKGWFQTWQGRVRKEQDRGGYGASNNQKQSRGGASTTIEAGQLAIDRYRNS